MKKRGKNNTALIILLVVLGIIALFFVSCSVIVFSSSPLSGNIALIPIKGPITVDGISGFGSDSTSSTKTIEFLKQAEDSPMIKAIVLEINSPGGSAVASKEVADAVKRTEKPVYAVIRELGASGAYWIASSSDYVIANPMSITGSVGVLSSYLEFSGLIQRYNITYQRLVAGKYKDMGTPLKKLQPDEEKILQDKINKIHSIFVNEVSHNRNLSQQQANKIKSAEFYLGTEALELNLIDSLGDLESAKQLIKKDIKLEKPEYAKYEKPKGLIDMLNSIFSYHSFHVGRGLGSYLYDASSVKKFQIMT